MPAKRRHKTQNYVIQGQEGHIETTTPKVARPPQFFLVCAGLRHVPLEGFDAVLTVHELNRAVDR